MAVNEPARALTLDDVTVFDEAVSDWHCIQVPSWCDKPFNHCFHNQKTGLVGGKQDAVKCNAHLQIIVSI